MSEQKINFSDYKSSGVYFLEYDNSVVSTANTQTALRLAVGFNMTGPFNRPVYIENATDINNLFGPINRTLERKGCFTNRNLRTMVRKTPVYALNLLPVNTKESSNNTDKVGYSFLSFDASKNNKDGSTLFANMYNRTQFWVADDKAFVNKCFSDSLIDPSVNSLETGPLFGVANCGTKDISIIVRKAENLTGWNISFLDWYGSEESIPYKCVRPTDLLSDYFIEVYAVYGNWSNNETIKKYAEDPIWSAYFDKTGLKKGMLNKFLRLDTVNVAGTWTGFLFPEFIDKQGNIKSIDYLINKSCNKTGLLFSINEHALTSTVLLGDPSDGYDYYIDGQEDPSTLSAFQPDLTGKNIKANDVSTKEYSFLSYYFKKEDDASTMFKNVSVDPSMDPSGNVVIKVSDASTISFIEVGDYIRNVEGLMSKVLKKRVTNTNSAEYTIAVPAKVTVSGDNKTVEVHKPFHKASNVLKFISLEGLKITAKLMPGFDEKGKTDLEAGVHKIYDMLNDEGIRKGLLNRDVIDYRYVIDTMGHGLKSECGAKVELTKLARDKGSCTALCSVPSMSDFAKSDKPFFGKTYTTGEARPTFDVKYIPEGGNSDMVYDPSTEMFSLPDEGNGAQFCGFFAPYLKYQDRTNSILVPPAADVSNTFMNKFTGGNPYATVANLNGIITGEPTDVEYIFDSTDRDALEPFGINPIIKRNGNIMIYGDRTAYQIVNSDLSFLHVRELLNFIEAQCRAVLDNYVFTYNTPTTRAEVVSRLNPILSAMKDSDALAKYEIQCDENNNTADVINEKFCIVDIGVWVNQNMEKIVTRITLNRSTTA